MNVLSLFDGISAGQVALERAGIKVDNYYASEIDRQAIKVTMTNYPNTVQLGDVTKLNCDELPQIDLLIGGSPCTSFSFAGKRNGMTTKDDIEILSLEQYLQLKSEGFEFEGQSYLFWEYMRILQEVKPKYFLLENVIMGAKWQAVLTEAIGCEAIEINSSLVSAQNRRRLYWTNIPNVTQPIDKGIKLQDILEDDGCLLPDESLHSAAIRGRYLNKATILGRRLDENGIRKDYDKSVKITQCLEVRASNTDKSNCLTTVAKDNVLTPMSIGRHPDVYGRKLPYRNLTPVECARLQTFPDEYCSAVSKSQQLKVLGNSWTVDVITHIFGGLK